LLKLVYKFILYLTKKYGCQTKYPAGYPVSGLTGNPAKHPVHMYRVKEGE
jgi:hypothetical protein